MRIALLSVSSCAVVTLVLAACASDPKSAPNVPETGEEPVPDVPPQAQSEGVPTTLVGAWLLTSIGRSTVTIAPDAHNAPSMTVMADGSLAGGGGVNSWGSKVDVKGLSSGRFEMSMPFSTMMAGDPDAMKLESEFMRALNATRSYVIADGRLTLRNAEGKDVLVFRRK